MEDKRKELEDKDELDFLIQKALTDDDVPEMSDLIFQQIEQKIKKHITLKQLLQEYLTVSSSLVAMCCLAIAVLGYVHQNELSSIIEKYTPSFTTISMTVALVLVVLFFDRVVLTFFLHTYKKDQNG